MRKNVSTEQMVRNGNALRESLGDSYEIRPFRKELDQPLQGYRPEDMYMLGVTIALALIQPTVSAGVAGDSPVPVSGFLGEQVVLPCIFKGNVTISDLLVVWQISEREILLKFVNGSDDLTEQDAHFRNRTTLFKDQLEQGNWSVLISDLRESDQHQFACQISDRTGVRFHQHVQLSVTEQARTPGPNTPVPDDSLVPVAGFLGKQVVLPCAYKVNVSVSDLHVIWETPEHEILHSFVNGNDNLTEQHPQFRSRTQLFKNQLEQGNWSVLISDLRESDQNQFVCQIFDRTSVHFHQHVNLSVTDPGLSTGARVGLGIGIPVFVVAGIVVFIILKRQSQKQNRCKINQNEASNGVPLTEVACPGEARGLVTTAPEHQDGAAGEQNRLRNGTVQH
ncbi:CD276 antigen homolog [Scyliorhinus torazame]|uniref:CD276 antigen homolog n=1 Tax=Scyliorhinus torazame TaxID=75743 RepID=UPI003B5CB471